jgi:hypothetical protein
MTVVWEIIPKKKPSWVYLLPQPYHPQENVKMGPGNLREALDIGIIHSKAFSE